MLTENDVVDAVCEHLIQNGFTIQNQLTTRERGIDIVALNPATGAEILIEAKGETSSKGHTKRFGEPFHSAQVKVHVAEAFYKAVSLQSNASGAQQSAMAFPDTILHRRYLEHIRPAVDMLGIEVFLVNHNRIVRKWQGSVGESDGDSPRRSLHG